MRHMLWPIVTFIVICLIGYGARTAIGNVYGAAEARILLESLSRAGLYLASAIATSSATTIALMLTLIGMIRRMDEDFDNVAYRKIDMVARLATATLLVSLVVLLAFTLPIGEFEQLPSDWYATLYNALFAGCVLVVAMSAATVVTIYGTLRRVITAITPGDEV